MPCQGSCDDRENKENEWTLTKTKDGDSKSQAFTSKLSNRALAQSEGLNSSSSPG